MSSIDSSSTFPLPPPNVLTFSQNNGENICVIQGMVEHYTRRLQKLKKERNHLNFLIEQQLTLVEKFGITSESIGKILTEFSKLQRCFMKNQFIFMFLKRLISS
jgi:hypothetical protein